MVNKLVKSFRPDVIVTVAHGWWHIQARKIANKLSLPLVTFFQDWWPDFPDVPSPFRSRVESQVRQTAAASAKVICVSDGMRHELGEPENAIIVHDAPSLIGGDGTPRDFQLPLRVAYFGNLSEYGPFIESALRAFQGSERARLEVFGPTPRWTRGTEDEFRSRGFYHGFMSSNELAKSLHDFQAALVVMSFAPQHRRRMKTSFPSKLIDATQLGLPLIIWGPEYCSAVKWARNGDKALCVTDPNPAVLREALEELAACPDELRRFAKSASDAAAAEFNYDQIQLRFIDALRRAQASVKPSGYS
jgi:glycosyltransferase involved in cell wall biosynthesis